MSATGQWLIELIEQGQAGDQAAQRMLIANGYGSAVAECCEAALDYATRLGWAIIPQRPGSKNLAFVGRNSRMSFADRRPSS